MSMMYVLVGGIIGTLLVAGLVYFLFFRKKTAGGIHGTGVNIAANLQNEQAKSDIILSTIEDGVVLIDNHGIIQLFNKGAEKITGWTSTDAVGLDHHSVLQFINDRSIAYTTEQNPLDRIFTEIGTIHDNSGCMKTHSDKTISVDVSVSPLITANNTIDGAVAVFRDVSEQRKEEQQRAEFISTASHEMRTPVAAIEGYLALALNEKVSKIDSKARDYLEKAHNSTKHLGSLFQDLLTAAKSEDGRLINHPQVVEMGHYLQEIVDGARFTAEQKKLLLDFMLGSDGGQLVSADQGSRTIRPLYYVLVDPERMREVITNLFDNAVKYTEEGRIVIGLTGDDQVVQFRITDTGQGIPPEDISHLFQKFYRVDSSATRTIGGTGLGLFICKKIVDLYNGRIWVESELGKGSTFFINLPRLTTERANELMAQAATPGANLVQPTNADAPPSM